MEGANEETGRVCKIEEKRRGEKGREEERGEDSKDRRLDIGFFQGMRGQRG